MRPVPSPINGNEAMRTRDAYTSIKAPGLPAGLHYLILQVLDPAGAPGLLDLTVAFEVTEHPPPEQIVPLPAGDTGKSLPVPPELGGSLDGKSEVLLPFGFLDRLNKQACCCS